MNNCEYHPTHLAQFYCKSCDVKFCDKCSDPSGYSGEAYCLKCNQQLFVAEESNTQSRIKSKIKTRMNSGGDFVERNSIDVCLAKVNILVIDGDFNQVVLAFEHGIKQNPENYQLHSKFFEFLVATHASEKIVKFGRGYLTLLIKTHRKERLYSSYKSILDITNDFNIIQLNNKVQIARACYERGNYKQCVTILQYVRHEHPRDHQIIEAFQLMHDALIFIPGQEKTGMRVREILKELMAKQLAGSQLVDSSVSKSAIRTTLKPAKRIDVHANKKTFDSLSISNTIKKERGLDSGATLSPLELDDDPQNTQIKSKYSNYGVSKESSNDVTLDELIMDEEIDYKGFNSDKAVLGSHDQVFEGPAALDGQILNDEFESIGALSSDFLNAGSKVEAVPKHQIPVSQKVDVSLSDDLTLDDSDSISNALKEKHDTQLELTLGDEDTQKTVNTESSIEFTDAKASKKSEKKHYDDDLGAISFD